MIGGHDVSVDGPVLSDDMDVLLRSARAAWPQALVESGDGRTLVSIGWVFEEDAAERAQQSLREMDEVDRLFDDTFGRPIDPRLAEAICQDVARFKPLVQTFASSMTTPIRTMVYCILDGAQVKAIRFEYRLKACAHLEVDVEYDSGERATFKSDNLWDAEALRHFGLMKMGDKPVIDGYYAFRKG
jgi:hypothetical protein